MKLNVIITSTRPGRVGEAVGRWFHDYARRNPQGFEVVLTDLAEVKLPLYDEPHHPRMKTYQHDHTRRWSGIIDGSDAFVFVLPEYNYTAPPSFFNAVDYLYDEWNYKPASFVSYGGVSGGMRAAQSAKSVLTTVKVMPIPEQVTLPMVAQQLGDGVLVPNALAEESADAMIGELARWAKALAAARTDAAQKAAA